VSVHRTEPVCIPECVCMHAWVGCCHLFYSLNFLLASSPSSPVSSPIMPTMTNASLPAHSPPHLPLHPSAPWLPTTSPSHPTPCLSICPSQFPYTLPLLPAHLLAMTSHNTTPTWASTVCDQQMCKQDRACGRVFRQEACVHACIWSFHACVGAGVCTDVHIAMYV